MQFAHFGKKRRPLLYLLLPLPRNEQLDKKRIFFFVLFIYIFFYNNIKIKQAALSWLKLPVRFPARNDSKGRGLSICLQCRLFAFRKGFAYLIQKALLNYSSTASVSSTTEFTPQALRMQALLKYQRRTALVQLLRILSDVDFVN